MSAYINSFTYFNSRSKSFSIQSRSGASKGIVVASCPIVEVMNVKFKVSLAGRQRVLREQVKNVHAGLMGFASPLELNPSELNLEGMTKVRYNPYQSEHFLTEGGKPVMACRRAILANQSVWVEDPVFLPVK